MVGPRRDDSHFDSMLRIPVQKLVIHIHLHIHRETKFHMFKQYAINRLNETDDLTLTPNP